jgi:hypothetical protein
MDMRRRRLRGTWTREGDYEDEQIRLYSGPGGWELHHTGEAPRVALTESAAWVAVRAITGDAWRFVPPPCDCQLRKRQRAAW